VGGLLALLALAGVATGEAAVVERLLDAHGWGTPAREAPLDEAAARLAARLADRPEAPAPDAAAVHVRFVLDELGIDDADVRPFTVRYDAPADFEARLPALLARLDRRFPPTAYGLATVARNGALTTTVVLVHRGLTLDEPLPRTAAPGDLVRVAGKLRRGYFRPRVLIAPPGRPVSELDATADERRASAVLSLDAGTGAYGIELVADSAYGPVVLLNHKVYAGVEPPTLPTVRLAPPAPAGVAPDRALLTSINADRARLGAPPLAWDERLVALAREQAAALARLETLAHDTPDRGTLATRARAAGLRFVRVAENLADADGPDAALQAFLESPGHKRNVEDPDLTHVGIAVQGRYFVVAFARWK
jgi:hypothetical protein